MSHFRNLGPVSQSWLESIGIFVLEDLQRQGAEGAYLRVIEAGFPASLNFLYAVEGAIHDQDWKEIAEARKEELRQFVKACKAQTKNPSALIRRKKTNVRRRKRE